jgi:light-regulated signal transduction histidine kinase (bacteriophytochrome)
MELGVNEMQLDGNRMFVGTIRDISERAAAEHEIRSHVNALQRSNQELDDFAYIASHDLKEPLRGLSHNARFLMEDFGDQISEAAQRRLARMTYLCQRMERLVDDLLYFSRLGRQDLAVKPTDLNAIIHDIETMMETTMQEAGARILIPERLPVIICDQPRVAELFRNLITNAVKYNDKPEKHVIVGHARQAEGDVFFVRDNGIGIMPRYHQEVFRIFRRLNDEDDAVKGTGVGLTFVKKIVERHGGRIWIDSEPGRGSTFYFTLSADKEGTAHERDRAHIVG